MTKASKTIIKIAGKGLLKVCGAPGSKKLMWRFGWKNNPTGEEDGHRVIKPGVCLPKLVRVHRRAIYWEAYDVTRQMYPYVAPARWGSIRNIPLKKGSHRPRR